MAAEYISLKRAQDDFGISPSKLREWIKIGEISAYQPTNKLLISTKELRRKIKESQINQSEGRYKCGKG